MRHIALLLVLVGASGCVSTAGSVDRTDAAAVARVHEATVGQTATLALASGEVATGRIRSVRPDSVAWDTGGLRRAVPTSAVFSIVVVARRREAARGTLGGTVFGTVLSLVAVVYNESGPSRYDRSIIAASAASIVVVAAAFGAAVGGARARRVEYVFTDGPPGPPR